MKNQLSIFGQKPQDQEARELRDLGIQRAEDHAGLSWKDLAGKYLRHYLHNHPNEFSTEDFRIYCKHNGLPDPPDNRAFGGTMMRARIDGLITRVGYGRAKNPKCHKGIVTLWKRT